MTDPIKRAGIGPADPSAPGAAETPRTEAFRETLGAQTVEAPVETQRSEGPSAAAQASIGELSRLAEAVRAGQLSPAQVIDALVARQLESPMAKMLSAPQRAQLEAVLRSRLESDPTLAAMAASLDRSSETR